MAAPTLVVCQTARKLKHMALQQIHYQLINTSLIFLYRHWNYCNCYEFTGCCLKPKYRRLIEERNYCYICQMRVTCNIDEIYKIQKIRNIINIFWELKEDIQKCLVFDIQKPPVCDMCINLLKNEDKNNPKIYIIWTEHQKYRAFLNFRHSFLDRIFRNENIKDKCGKISHERIDNHLNACNSFT